MLILQLLVLLIVILFALSSLIAFFGGKYLIKRRKPDPADSPDRYGLPYEDVSFASRYKVMLRGWWIPAPNPKGTIIFCHGQNGSMEGDLPQAVAFHQAGYNVLMFNLRAHGTSEGNTVTFGVFEKEDLLGAIDFLTVEKDITQVAILGMSMGAGVAMIAAALSDKVKVLILDGIFERFAGVVEAAIGTYLPLPLAKAVTQLVILGATILTNTRMYQVSPKLWAKHLDHVPVLFIHAENDQFITQAEVERLAADLNGAYKIWVAKGSQHRRGFYDHPAEYNAQVLGWLKEHYPQS